MKLDQDEIQEFLEIIDQSEAFRPIINVAIEKILSFGPELSKLLEGILLGVVDLKTKMVLKYEQNGFKRDEAIALAISDLKFIQDINTKKTNQS